jgi:tRNA (cytidine/uridine-2'-O-)-methyltransferase
MKTSNFNIVLVCPQIPNNTGNIGRLCVGSQSKLHLVHPLGFEITDTRVKRAGLDYWPDLDLMHHASFEKLLACIPDLSRVFFFSAQATQSYYDLDYRSGDWLVFGREADGLPKEILKAHASQCVKIPFPGKVRSFNLGNAVAMALGEGLRQLEL